MKKQPYTLSAYIPRKTGNPIPFNTETTLQTQAHAAGVADDLQLILYTIPVLEIRFSAPPDPFCPDVPKQQAQDAALRLLQAEIRYRYPAHGKIKYKLYHATP